MAGSDSLPEGKHQKHPHRKRTMFTEKQLGDLTLLFNRNPYPDPSLKKEMASKMNLDPMVLQVWFKNHRAKLKKENRKVQPKQEAPPQQCGEPEAKAELEAKTEPEAKGDSGPPSSSPEAAPAAPVAPTAPAARGQPGAPLMRPMLPVYTHCRIPSFRLSACPHPFKVHPLHAGSHKMVHFGCCRDPTVYCLHPISDAPRCAPGCASAQRHPSVPSREAA